MAAMSLEGSYFSKIKGDYMTGQVRVQCHCDLRFSQIENILSRSSATNCADAQAGLRFCCSQTTEDKFSRVEAHMNHQI